MLMACRHCGLIQRLPTLGPGSQAVCHRCGLAMTRATGGLRGRQRTLAAAVAALVLYFPAISLPMLVIFLWVLVYCPTVNLFPR